MSLTCALCLWIIPALIICLAPLIFCYFTFIINRTYNESLTIKQLFEEAKTFYNDELYSTFIVLGFMPIGGLIIVSLLLSFFIYFCFEEYNIKININWSKIFFPIIIIYKYISKMINKLFNYIGNIKIA